jgi:hypothetical protein
MVGPPFRPSPSGLPPFGPSWGCTVPGPGGCSRPRACHGRGCLHRWLAVHVANLQPLSIRARDRAFATPADSGIPVGKERQIVRSTSELCVFLSRSGFDEDRFAGRGSPVRARLVPLGQAQTPVELTAPDWVLSRDARSHCGRLTCPFRRWSGAELLSSLRGCPRHRHEGDCDAEIAAHGGVRRPGTPARGGGDAA